ncbi:MAG: serine hydrolase, partial [Planctomycetota bacterium]
MNRRVLAGTGIAAAASILAVAVVASGPAKIGAAYKAKILCSETFVAGRDPVDVAARDFEDISPALGFIRHRIDRNAKSVRTSLFGLGTTVASFDGAGCAYRAPGKTALSGAGRRPVAAAAPLPVNRKDAAQAIAAAAVEDEIAGHRALVALVDGAIVAEAYAEDFDAETPFQSWSMAKSVLATLIGKAAGDGLVDVAAPAPVPEWREDPARAMITWRDLLRMESGLAWEEDYVSPSSDVNRMLFTARDFGAAAAKAPAGDAPGETFYYSSGTSNVLARTLHAVLNARDVELRRFAADAIFKPIGASSFVLETDPSGVFAGSSYVYATARDWARLGLLYVNGGRAPDGSIVIPADWTDFVRTPTDASDLQYGAHFWLNRDGRNGRSRDWPGLPESMYSMSGHDGQYVFIFPEENAVIVSTGISRNEASFAAV